jgi:hypothetical protein
MQLREQYQAVIGERFQIRHWHRLVVTVPDPYNEMYRTSTDQEILSTEPCLIHPPSITAW